MLSLRVLLGALVGWLDQRQQEALAYLIEKNRILRGQPRGRRLQLSDDDRPPPCHDDRRETKAAAVGSKIA